MAKSIKLKNNIYWDGSCIKQQDTGWKTATMNEGFTNNALSTAGDLMYRRIGSIVYIKGSVKGFPDTTSPCTRLPSGYRPSSRIDFYGSESGNYMAKFAINTAGDIWYIGGTRGSVADTQWFNLCTSFVTDQAFPS